MKKTKRLLLILPVFVILCAALLFLTACSRVETSLEKIPEDYSLEQAKSDGCVVHENSDITAGQEVWDGFVEKCEAGQKASVLLTSYHTIDRESMSEELYEQEKDKYPVLYVHELCYDGNAYFLFEKDDEDRNVIRRSKYRYMKRYEGEPNSESASYSSYVYYVLVNEDVTWEQIMHGMASSKWGDYIDFRWVYQKHIR